MHSASQHENLKPLIDQALKNCAAFSLLLLLFATTSCHVFKRATYNGKLLKSVEVQIDAPNDIKDKIDVDKLTSFCKQMPNEKTLGIVNFGLLAYNMIDHKKEKQREIKRKIKDGIVYDRRVKRGRKMSVSKEEFERWTLGRWFNRLTEEPVLYDSVKSVRSVEQMNAYLRTKGFYHTSAYCIPYNKKPKADSIRSIIKYLNTRKKSGVVPVVSDAAPLKSVKLCYWIQPSKPVVVDSIRYNIEDSTILEYFSAHLNETLIKKGNLLDADLLQNERARITSLLKANGYYNFDRDYTYFEADTLGRGTSALLTLGIMKANAMKNGKLVKENHKQYFIRNVNFFTSYDPKLALEQGSKYINSFSVYRTDTISPFYFYNDLSKYKILPSVIFRQNFIVPDRYYNVNHIQTTYNHLLSLGTFKLVSINFDELSIDSVPYIDCKVYMTPSNKQTFKVVLEGTSTNGSWGFASDISYRHKNLFNRAWIWDLQLRLAKEAQTSVFTRDNPGIKSLNTSEQGFETSLKIPRFLMYSTENFSINYNIKTILSAMYNKQERSEYTRSIANGSFGYFWNGKNHNFIKYNLNLADVNIIYISRESDAFRSSIKDPFLLASYQNQMILSGNYSMVIDNQEQRINKSHSYLRFYFESAGFLASKIAKPDTDNLGKKSLLGNSFAQYLKFDLEGRYYAKLGGSDFMVFRGYLGLGVPYGNSKESLPFIKKYYSGGSTSIRAWQVRTVGPGSYKDSAYDRLADMKVEMNVEYRSKLFWLLESALFLDAGNIWNYRAQANLPGADFKVSRFLTDLALGTGWGVRANFSVLIVRVDFGFKLRDPADGWLPNRSLFSPSSWSINFGIGYPF